MSYKILLGVLLPFFGTSLGAFMVFFLKKSLSDLLFEILNGFAAGVMLAASIWSLLIPSISSSSSALIPVVGFLGGFAFLICLEKTVSLFVTLKETSCRRSTFLLLLAVALHNLPEGVAVGVVFAECLLNQNFSLYTTALAFSLGITIQNIPEGAIISCPLYASGTSRCKSFLLGVGSGVIEPIGAVLALLSLGFSLIILPFLLSFTAGAMVYVVVKNLLPEILSRGKLSGVIFFSLGFSVMMLLDISL